MRALAGEARYVSRTGERGSVTSHGRALLVLLLPLVACTHLPTAPASKSAAPCPEFSAPLKGASESATCEKAGGQWIRFSSTCTRDCRNYYSEICGMAFTEGCSCPGDTCFNGNECVPLRCAGRYDDPG